MAYVIPNTGDTTGGNKFASLKQAEPDSVDIEVLGNAESGVITGCAVTVGTSPSVNVAEGRIVLDGAHYDVSAGTVNLGGGPVGFRFDLVVVRVTGGVASLTSVSGDDAVSFPEFPQTANASSDGTFDLSTDVLLAAVFRDGSTSITAANITDKRAGRKISPIYQVADRAPTSGDGDSTGQLFFDTTAQTGVNSGLSVKDDNGSWVSLAKPPALPDFPIGGVFAWPVSGNLPSNTLLCSGAALSTGTYPDLFSVLGYTFGGSGSTFYLPNYNANNLLTGTTNGGNMGNTVGANTINLTTGQMPLHAHEVVGHSHSIGEHTHGMDHGHSGGSAAQSSNGQTTSSGNHDHNLEFAYQIVYDNSSPSIAASGSTAPIRISPTPTVGHDGHAHAFYIKNYTGDTGGVEESNVLTSPHPASGNASTLDKGSNANIDIRSKASYVFWAIRAT